MVAGSDLNDRSQGLAPEFTLSSRYVPCGTAKSGRRCSLESLHLVLLLSGTSLRIHCVVRLFCSSRSSSWRDLELDNRLVNQLAPPTMMDSHVTYCDDGCSFLACSSLEMNTSVDHNLPHALLLVEALVKALCTKDLFNHFGLMHEEAKRTSIETMVDIL